MELLIRECVSCYVLFHAMLIHGVVPSMFGIGIIVPLFKGHNLDSSISDNFVVLCCYKTDSVSVLCPTEKVVVFGRLFQSLGAHAAKL